MRRLLSSVIAAVALAGCAGVTTTAEEPPSATAPTLTHPYGAATAPEPRPSAPSSPAPHPRTPTRLLGPQIVAPVVPLRLDGSALVPPDDPTVLGWWGRRAGAAHGVTLLVGHTVSTGGGTLDDLDLIPVGADLRLDGLTYTVRTNRVISKARLARRAPRLFDQTGPHRLVLVTCEDYDTTTRTYASNVVLTATRSTP